MSDMYFEVKFTDLNKYSGLLRNCRKYPNEQFESTFHRLSKRIWKKSNSVPSDGELLIGISFIYIGTTHWLKNFCHRIYENYCDIFHSDLIQLVKAPV